MAFQLTVEVNPTSLSIKPGGSAALGVTIHNISSVVQHYTVQLLGLPAEGMVTIPAEPTKLRPREAGDVQVTLNLPETSAVRAGTYRVGVRVVSAVDPTVARTTEVSLAVLPVAGIDLSVYPELVEGGGDATFTITARNTGNSPSGLSLDVRDEQGRARIDVVPPALDIPPLSTSTAAAHIQMPRKLLGAPQQVQLKVGATDNRNPERKIESSARLVVNPRIPVGVARALGVLLVVGVTAGSIIVGGMLARPAPTPPPVIPTSVVTSGEGDKPPAAAKIRLDPAAPQAGVKVTFTATTTDQVQDYAWDVSNADGISVTSSTQPSFAFAFDVGTYRVKVTISAPGGKSSTEQPFTVTPQPPPVQLVSNPIELAPGMRVNHPVSCPEGTIAVGGGLVDDTGTATDPLLRASYQTTDDKTKWTVSARSTNPRQARYVAVCIKEPAQGIPILKREPAATAGQRVLTATCPAGTVLLGGGGSTGLSKDVDTGWVRESVPSKDGGGNWTSWTAVIETEVPTKAAAFVYCSAAPPGYQVIDQAQAIGVGSGTVQVIARCPAGTLSLGGGAGLEGTAFGVPPVVGPPAYAVDLLTTAPNTAMAGQIDQGWLSVLSYSSVTGAQTHTVVICAALK